MYLVGARGQQRQDLMYYAEGTISSGGTAQALLPAAVSRSYLLIQNLSDTIMYVKFGAARLTCTISGGVVNAVTVVDGGFGFTANNGLFPMVTAYGGGSDQTFYGGSFIGVGQPDYPAPVTGSNNVALARPAKLLPVMGTSSISGKTISSVTIEDGGAGYLTAPYLHVMNNLADPIGCATAAATASVALQPATGASSALNNRIEFNGTFCPTTPISIFCASSSKAFLCMWAS